MFIISFDHTSYVLIYYNCEFMDSYFFPWIFITVDILFQYLNCLRYDWWKVLQVGLMAFCHALIYFFHSLLSDTPRYSAGTYYFPYPNLGIRHSSMDLSLLAVSSYLEAKVYVWSVLLYV